MTRITEQDFELLEEYLDEALGDRVRLDLESRLSGDAALAAALDELRENRDLRGELFASLEPDNAAVRGVIDGINATVLRDDLRHHRWRGFGWTSSVAAGVAIAFLAGWMAHRMLGGPGTAGPSVAGGGSGIVAVNEAYAVQITDDAGKVVAIQKFDSLEKAREFTDDLTKWQLRQQQLQQGQVVLVGDTF